VYRGCAEDKCAVAAAVDNARVELAGEENGRLVGRAITSLCAVVKRGRGVGGGGEERDPGLLAGAQTLMDDIGLPAPE
jgi:hypothetical protein